MSWIWVPLAAALLDWTAVAKRWDGLQPVTNAAVPAAVALWILLETGTPSGPQFLLLAGVLSALVGDVLLLSKPDRFLPALAAYSVTHAAWIAGLNATLPPFNLSTLMLAAAVVLPAIEVTRRVQAGMARRNTRPGPAAGLYALALAVLVFSGLATLAKEDWLPAAALLAASGVVLYALSNVALVWDRFAGALPQARLARRVLYHLGIVALALGGMMLSP